jgi:hypothetical protein
MTRMIRNLRPGRMSKALLTTVGAAAAIVVPNIASARDHDYDRGDRYHDAREWRHDDYDRVHHHDDVRLNLGIAQGLYPAAPQRVWVEPVYRTVCDRVWVAPEYRTVCDRVWREPVTQDVCERVWVEPCYETRERVWFDRHGARHCDRERVLVSPGHWQEQHRTVVVSAGHWEDVSRQELVCDGHWQNVERQEVVTPGHWEEHYAQVDARPGWSIGFGIGKR